MHEVGLMQDALGIALEHAAQHGARCVHTIGLRVGPLSGVNAEALEFAFDIVTSGTIAAGARLEVDRVPIVCDCASCGLTFRPDVIAFECPACHSPDTQVRQGRELELAYVEVS